MASFHSSLFGLSAELLSWRPAKNAFVLTGFDPPFRLA